MSTERENWNMAVDLSINKLLQHSGVATRVPYMFKHDFELIAKTLASAKPHKLAPDAVYKQWQNTVFRFCEALKLSNLRFDLPTFLLECNAITADEAKFLAISIANTKEKRG